MKLSGPIRRGLHIEDDDEYEKEEYIYQGKSYLIKVLMLIDKRVSFSKTWKVSSSGEEEKPEVQQGPRKTTK